MNLKRALRVWQRNFKVYTKLYKSSIALNFVEPVMYLAAMGLGLGGYVEEINGVPYIHFLAPGIIASSAMFAATFESTFGTYVRWYYQKTFDGILATPVSPTDLVVGELMWCATKAFIYGTIITIVISVLGLVSSPWIILAPAVAFLTGLVFASLGHIAASMVPGIDSFSYYTTMFITPLFLFSGVFFPLDQFPDYVIWIANITPLYHVVNLTRGLALGELAGLWIDLLWLVATCAILMPIAFGKLKNRLVEAR